jgi:hypothetical protein
MDEPLIKLSWLPLIRRNDKHGRAAAGDEGMCHLHGSLMFFVRTAFDHNQTREPHVGQARQPAEGPGQGRGRRERRGGGLEIGPTLKVNQVDRRPGYRGGHSLEYGHMRFSGLKHPRHSFIGISAEDLADKGREIVEKRSMHLQNPQRKREGQGLDARADL